LNPLFVEYRTYFPKWRGRFYTISNENGYKWKIVSIFSKSRRMPDQLISAALVAVAMTVTPGPATVLIAAMGARFGFQRSLPLLAGVAAGLAALMAVAAAGLATMLQAVPALHVLMNAAGSAYLLWLAWKIGRGGAPAAEANATMTPAGFVSGIVLLWLNPKAWTMALGAGAAFAGLAPDPVAVAFLLAAVFGTAAALALSLWCVGGAALGRRLRTARQWQAVNGALGLLTAASVGLLWM
jgi:threonine/homoserine/homoserine lactone efflux protein